MKKKYIKYTLFGFNQLKAHELGLDLVDLALMRWFIDFKDFKDKETGKKIMISKVIDNEVMYWVQYDGVKEALPIAKLNNADSVYRRFKKLVKAGILEHKTIKQGGVYSYYTVGKNYADLISEEYNGTSDINPIQSDENQIGTDKFPSVTDTNPNQKDINPMQTDKNPEQKINLIHSSNNNKSNIDKKEQSSSSDSTLGIREEIAKALLPYSNYENCNAVYDTWFKNSNISEINGNVKISVSKAILRVFPRKYIAILEKALNKKIELLESN